MGLENRGLLQDKKWKLLYRINYFFNFGMVIVKDVPSFNSDST